MPEIIVYTNDGDCANGVAEIQPFTTGDATDEWTIKFNNGADFYAVSNVTMNVGHVNGLPNGTYNSAFKWSDRAGTESVANISVTNGVPNLQFNSNPAGGLVGGSGVYILRGPNLDGSLSSASIEYAGRYLTFAGDTTVTFELKNDLPGHPAVIQGSIDGGVSLESSGSSSMLWYQGFLSGLTILDAGKGFSSDLGFSTKDTTDPAITFSPKLTGHAVAGSQTVLITEPGAHAIISTKVNAPRYEFPFMSAESGNNIIAGTTLSPYSDGDVTSSIDYDHSTLVIRPETVATASLSASGTGSTAKWTGTMNPINAYTTARLSLRNSTQLDLQIRGDGRTLFQGQLTILNKIS